MGCPKIPQAREGLENGCKMGKARKPRDLHVKIYWTSLGQGTSQKQIKTFSTLAFAKVGQKTNLPSPITWHQLGCGPKLGWQRCRGHQGAPCPPLPCSKIPSTHQVMAGLALFHVFHPSPLWRPFSHVFNSGGLSTWSTGMGPSPIDWEGSN